MPGLIGLWVFVGLLYQGAEMPPPNPDLHIEFEFEASGQNRLKYWRTGERGFCERRALYEVREGELLQKVHWVNPANDGRCSMDTDMRMGNESLSPVRLEAGRFFLGVPLGEEQLFYIWEQRTPARPSALKPGLSEE